MKVSYLDILPLIPAKENGFITAKTLSIRTGYAESSIRKLINQARSAGVPICSKTFGYYFSEDYGDIADTIIFLSRRINTQLKAISGLANIKRKGV